MQIAQTNRERGVIMKKYKVTFEKTVGEDTYTDYIFVFAMHSRQAIKTAEEHFNIMGMDGWIFAHSERIEG